MEDAFSTSSQGKTCHAVGLFRDSLRRAGVIGRGARCCAARLGAMCGAQGCGADFLLRMSPLV